MWPFRKRTDKPEEPEMDIFERVEANIDWSRLHTGTVIYEPGVTHEHRCVASSAHPQTDHTCQCGKTWASKCRCGGPGIGCPVHGAERVTA